MLFLRVPLLVALLAGLACAGRSDRDVAEAPEPEPGDKTITADDIERNPSEPIERMLANRFPGIVVTRTPEGAIAIRIRGRTSILGSNEPLYVIDGVPIEAGPGGALFGINPHDIESIEVLTDPTSTTMYGSRGANGVVVIKTKVPERPSQ